MYNIIYYNNTDKKTIPSLLLRDKKSPRTLTKTEMFHL